MRNYIILNGKNSNEINGLLIQELPPISKPLIRTEVEEIDGRDGDIVTPLGYSAYDKEFTIGLYKDFDVNEVAAYFNSEGTVIFSNEPDKYYYYQITAQIDFERLVRYRTATVTMHCQPFKYSATEQPITEDVSGTVSDEGTNLVLENTAEAPFNTLDLKGNTSQQTYTGKNLLNASSMTGKTSGGLTTVVNNDGSITVSGTATDTWGDFTKDANISLENGVSYTLSIGDTLPFYLTCYLADPRQNIVITPGRTSASVTANSDKTRFHFYCSGLTVGQSYNVTIKKIQLEKGSTATAYEPYVGGIPAPNPDYPQAVQTVTGENVVKICGKNLFDKDKALDNYFYTSTGSKSTYSKAQFYNNEFTPTSNEITMSYSAAHDRQSGSNIEANVRIVQYDASGNFISRLMSRTNGYTFTLDANTKSFILCIDNGPDAWFDDLQVEYGSTATDYEPYQGQSYEVNLGKNLFDIQNATGTRGNNTVVASSQTITLNSNTSGTETAFYLNDVSQISQYLASSYSTARDYKITGLGGSYTLCITLANIPSGVGSLVWDVYTNKRTLQYSRSDIADGKITKTITLSSDEYIKSVQFYTSATSVFSDFTMTVQLEKGSQATSYAAYFTPIELCNIPGTDYRDRFIPRDGKWYVHKEVGKTVLVGTESIALGGTSTSGKYRFNITVSGVANVASTERASYSDNFIPATRNETYACTQGMSLAQNLVQIYCEETSAYDLDQFKAWLASHNTTVYYPLATPTDTEITNEALLAQLDDIYYHSHSYKGRTHITSSAATGNVPHIIAAEVGEDNESTITNAGNYLSKPKITVYGSGDISLYINDMHVLQITLGDEGYITIDTAQMEAYKDTLDNLKNRLVIGDYSNARLKPGANKIHFTGTVTKYIVENYSRWL